MPTLLSMRPNTTRKLKSASQGDDVVFIYEYFLCGFLCGVLLEETSYVLWRLDRSRPRCHDIITNHFVISSSYSFNDRPFVSVQIMSPLLRECSLGRCSFRSTRVSGACFSVGSRCLVANFSGVPRPHHGNAAIRTPFFSSCGRRLLGVLKAGHFAFAPDDHFARTFRFNLVSLGFALLLPFASLWKLEKENFASLSVRKIALWSYAIYLVHLPLFQLVMKYGFQDWRSSLIHAVILFVVTIGGAILLSALLFRFFERPCTGLRERVAPAVARVIKAR
jgi:hypothetical protein